MKKITLLCLLFFGLFTAAFAQVPDTLVENGKKYLIHEVVKGQTLYGLSRQYHWSVDSLIKDNPGTENGIQIGQRLKIYVGKAVEKKEITYVVQKGDNLYYIARKYGVTLQNLYDWNPGLTDRIDIGQKIKIIQKVQAQPSKQQGEPQGQKPEQAQNQKPEQTQDQRPAQPVQQQPNQQGQPEQQSQLHQQSETTSYISAKKEKKMLAPVGSEVQKAVPADTIPEESLRNEAMERRGEQKSEYRVFLLLPLYTQNVDDVLALTKVEDLDAYNRIKSFNFIQFYEAALLALEDLAPHDVKIHFYVKDVNEQNNEHLKKWISDGLFDDADMIIGPFFRTNFITLLSYIQGKNITMVNPFTINIDGNTAPLFKVTASYLDQAQNLADYVSHNYNKAQLILVNNHAADEKAISAFKTALYLQLQDYPSIIIKEVNYAQGGVSSVTSAINSTCENFVIAFFEGEISVTHFVQSLGKMKYDNLTLVASSKWRKYDKIENEYFASLKTHYFDQFYVDYSQPEVISFIDRFREAYSMEPTLDQFAFQGYDITYFFVKALVTFGNGFGEEVNQMEAPLLSTRFKFHKNNRLTYENGFVHLYRISDDFHYVNAWQAAEATEENLSTGKDAKNKRKK